MDWDFDWGRIGTAVAVVLVALVVARIVDRRMARRRLDPASVTRYRVLRRTVSIAIVAIGVLTALLTIPAVQTVAGGILASSAVVGLVVGFAAQRTIGNFIAGLLIAIAQPLRIGDRVTVDNERGVVEEIGLTYTFIRRDDGARVVIPNEKLASDTIVNSTIVSKDQVAEITLQVPLSHDVAAAVDSLRRETADYQGADVFVSALDGDATIVVRVPASDARSEEIERDLRLRAHTRLRADGVFA